MKVTGPRIVVEYTSCPDCDWWSIGVQANGRIVRHSVDCGSVERVPPPFVPSPICAGSGKVVALHGEYEWPRMGRKLERKEAKPKLKYPSDDSYHDHEMGDYP